MFENSSKNLPVFLAIFALFALLSVGFFGMSLTMGMEMKDDGKMGGCLFDGRAEICAMTFQEHLSQWQSMFTAPAPQKALAFALLLLVAVAFVAAWIFKRNILLLLSYYATRWRLYIRQNPNLILFNPLRLAFARGILNPKIY